MTNKSNSTKKLTPNRPLLVKNDLQAHHNRTFFDENEVLVINVLSSPGSGKTELIGRLIADQKDRRRVAVVTGDLATDKDAERLKQHADQVVQITTGTACHLDAAMVFNAVKQIDFSEVRILFIENVGNLVCPTMFDLGETMRIVVLSVTEGEDKPLKYPGIFGTAHAVVVNKMDLAKAVEFDRDTALNSIRSTAPGARIFEVSAKTGSGISNLWDSIENNIRVDGR
jgi:hydrogenase nickel incorporation protein HypB